MGIDFIPDKYGFRTANGYDGGCRGVYVGAAIANGKAHTTAHRNDCVMVRNIMRIVYGARND